MHENEWPKFWLPLSNHTNVTNKRRQKGDIFIEFDSFNINNLQQTYKI